MAASDIIVRMHPEDARVMRECLAEEPGERNWRIEPDPLLERGGCVLATPNSQVDLRLDTRLGRAIATMFDDQRQSDSKDDGHAPHLEDSQ